MSALQPNATLQGGKYKIMKVLGQGGFGITYLAKQPVPVEGPLGTINVDIEVTLKEFFMKDLCNRDETTSTVFVPSIGSFELVEKFRQKFIKEAQNISRLKHPNIIKVLDVFEENGTAYYAMEYINGCSLSELINRKGKLCEEETLFYTKKIASALQYIHSKNMNHLDVKPANVLLRKSGDVVLIDFGLSKNYDTTGLETTSTPVGISIGYAPIEQTRVGGVGKFSPATDIYSLGATMFKMLTGNTPPDASAILDDGLPELPTRVSATTKAAIIKAMEPRRKERYQSVADFLFALSLSEEEPQTISGEKVKNDVPKPTIPEIFPVTPQAVNDVEKTVVYTDDKDTTVILNHQKENFVDLGLSVRWCTYNVGSTSPEGVGNYFTINSFKNYTPNNGLRFPTREEWNELFSSCEFKWQDSGIAKFTAKNGASIIIPIAGRFVGDESDQKQETAFYWAQPDSLMGKFWFARITKSDASGNNVIAKTKKDIAMSIRLVQK